MSETLINPPWYRRITKKHLVIAAIGLFLLAVAVLWSCSDTKPLIEDDNAYKALAGENNILREQNAGLRKERDEAIAQAQARELERDGLIAELERFGKMRAAGVEMQLEAGKTYEKDIAVIGIDIPTWDRCQRYCSNRAIEGFPCKPDANAWCEKRYGGR